MKKLVTLSDEQWAHIEGLMRTLRITSFSELVRFLVLFYEEHRKQNGSHSAGG